MNSQIFHYSVRPSIVRADEQSTVVIHPLGENSAFMQGQVYKVIVREVETAHGDFQKFVGITYECSPNEDGDIVITHTFRGEQKHTLTITRPECDLRSPHHAINHRAKYGENISAVLGVYSLRPDLYGLRCYKGETHSHTYESDGIMDVCHTVGNYRSAGYDFLAITDHYISMSSEKAMRVFDPAPVDMTLLLGEEVHVPHEHIHAVHFGGRESVNAYFREHADEVRAEVAQLEQTLSLPENVPATDYAWRVWIARKARELGGLAVIAHPHWIWENVFFMGDSTTEQLLRDGVYDALELQEADTELAAAMWSELRAQGLHIPLVGSTDAHRSDPYEVNAPVRGCYTLVFAPDRSGDSIMSAIRAERSVCVDNKRTPAFIHGPYRLVKYARFLLDHYFPVYMRECRGQGPVLSEYPVEGEAPEALQTLLAALNARSEQVALDFFGY
jgi:hypothetical protein